MGGRWMGTGAREQRKQEGQLTVGAAADLREESRQGLMEVMIL